MADDRVGVLSARLRAERDRVVDARPKGQFVSGDVEAALLPIVLAELVPGVLPDVSREDVALLRWLAGWEPETLARVVALICRAADVAREGSGS